jgi:hypothetical protein
LELLSPAFQGGLVRLDHEVPGVLHRFLEPQ